MSISYSTKGSKLNLADTLSRAHLHSIEGNQNERAGIMNIKTFGEIQDVQLEEIRQATALDSSLQDVIQFVMEGWPEETHFVSPCACSYFDIRDTLTVVDGILLKGEAVIIPPALRTSIKKRLHSSHLGSESMLRRASDSVFWPHMSSDIKQMADVCEICQQMKPKNNQGPLKQHVDGDESWQKVGHDIFQIADKHYLVTVDYYSNFLRVL